MTVRKWGDWKAGSVMVHQQLHDSFLGGTAAEYWVDDVTIEQAVPPQGLRTPDPYPYPYFASATESFYLKNIKM